TGGSWVDGPASSPSPRGLSLAYRYRALPPGTESRFEWIVQVRGDAALLAGVETETWRMEPPPRHGGDLVSRDRAADGFPLFGDGPGGWFGVSATIRFKDGGAETLGRRVELPGVSVGAGRWALGPRETRTRDHTSGRWPLGMNCSQMDPGAPISRSFRLSLSDRHSRRSCPSAEPWLH